MVGLPCKPLVGNSDSPSAPPVIITEQSGLDYHREMAETRVVQVDLTKDERRVLEVGLIEWGGPAACTNEMALAMGFKGVLDLFDDGQRLANSIRDDAPLSGRDWTRALLATEIVFASNVIGSGLDWRSTTGFDDVVTIGLLRSLQRKLGGLRDLPGTRPRRDERGRILGPVVGL